MRARTVLIILLVLIVLIAFGPAIVAVGSQEIAEGFGCQVDLNRAIPCVIHGKDYGDTFYNLGFAIWYSYLSLPIGGVLCDLAGARDDRLARCLAPPGHLTRRAGDINHLRDHP
jgi:TRAP-type C4-dicarboxylate transport system permease small subunit